MCGSATPCLTSSGSTDNIGSIDFSRLLAWPDLWFADFSIREPLSSVW
jgi:hypothetical protein